MCVSHMCDRETCLTTLEDAMVVSFAYLVGAGIGQLILLTLCL